MYVVGDACVSCGACAAGCPRVLSIWRLTQMYVYSVALVKLPAL